MGIEKHVFGALFGGALQAFDVEEILKQIVTKTTAAAARPLVQEFFIQRMNAASRVALGQKLETVGKDLQAGEVAKASEVIADIIDDIRL